VRQWPGNSGDLDFRGVIARCTAMVVVAPPVAGAVSEGDLQDGFGGEKLTGAWRAFLASAEYKAMCKVLPFCRLWCIGAFRVGAFFHSLFM
jgi:hypothetical protein